MKRLMQILFLVLIHISLIAEGGDDPFLYDILTAALIGRPSDVKKRLSNGEDIETLSPKNETPLILAAKGEYKEFATGGGHKETVKLLLNKEANVNAKDDQGYTALLWAVTRGDPDIVQALIEAKSDLNVVNQQNQTVLFLAKEHGSKEVCRVLLRHLDNLDNKEELLFKAVGDQDDEFVYDILTAAWIGRPSNVEKCLSNEENIEKLSAKNETPLILAAKGEHKEFATEGGHKETVKLLLRNEANVNAKDDQGNTALLWAVTRDDPDIVQYLIDAHSDLNVVNQQNQTALSLATKYGSKGVFKILLNSLDINTEEHLFKAVEDSDIKLLEYLVFAEVNLEAKDQEGTTALMRACIKDDGLPAVEILVDGNADLEAENNAYQTALSLAVFHNRINSVEFLLEHNANSNHIDQYGTTPLIIAAYRGYADILRKLLRKGADPRFRTQKKIGLECEGLGEIRIPAGATALDFARKFNQGKDIIEELIRAERSFMSN